MSSLSIELKDFATHFRGCEVKPTRHDVLMQQALALRYDVYCRECRFLRAEDYPDQRESDEYDAQSAHFASFARSESMAGYVRLVRPDALGIFPFQTHCVQLLDGVQLPPAAKAAEISRLMVRESFRRRRGDLVSGASSAELGQRPAVELRDHSPQILLSLYREMYQYSIRHGVRYWYAAMEISLARILKRMNFGFQQIGPSNDYYGLVQPYVADLRDLEVKLGQSNPALLGWMQHTAAKYPHHEPAVRSSQSR